MEDLKYIKIDIISLNSLSDIKEFGFKREPYIFSDKDLDFMEKTLAEIKNKILSHSPFDVKNKVIMSSQMKGGDNYHTIYLENDKFQIELPTFYSNSDIASEILEQCQKFYNSL